MPIKRLSQSGLLTFEKYSSMLAGNTAYVPPGAYELINTQIVSGSSTNSVSFDLSSYTSTYKHYQLRATFRSTRGVGDDLLYIRLNGDSSNTYPNHQLFNASSSAYVPREGMIVIYMPDNAATSGLYAGLIVDILDANNTNKNKTIRALIGTAGSQSNIQLNSAMRPSTEAITSISIGHSPYGNIAANSRISIYGLRSA